MHGSRRIPGWRPPIRRTVHPALRRDRSGSISKCWSRLLQTWGCPGGDNKRQGEPPKTARCNSRPVVWRLCQQRSGRISADERRKYPVPPKAPAARTLRYTVTDDRPASLRSHARKTWPTRGSGPGKANCGAPDTRKLAGFWHSQTIVKRVIKPRPFATLWIVGAGAGSTGGPVTTSSGEYRSLVCNRAGNRNVSQHRGLIGIYRRRTYL